MGRDPVAKLNALSVSNMKRVGNWPDGGGLYLRVRPDGSKNWAFRFKLAGKTHWMSLGPIRDVTLAEAREAARKARNGLREGVNPLEARRERQSMAMNEAGRTFDAVAALYIDAHKAGWKNAKHGEQWAATLKTYASPVIGGVSVGKIGLDEVLRILRPIWTTKPETASRLRGRIESVLDYAAVHRWRTGDNPARWTGFLDQILPAKSKVRAVEHHAALPWVDMPAVMAKLAASTGTGAACLRFCILTATRSGEARGARWNEIDLATKTWTIPAARMKAKAEHRVPLSDAALAILRAAWPPEATDKPACGLVFPGGKKSAPLSDVGVSKALRAAAADVTVHGCRSSFRDWAGDASGFASEVAEAALAHTMKDKTEAAYARTDHFERRRKLMDAWAAHCSGEGAEPAGNVTRLHASAKN